MTATIQNLFIDQGADLVETFDYPNASDGDTARAQLRQWPHGPLLATFEASVDADGKMVTVELTAATTAALLRSGWYDVQVVNGLDTVTIARGFARLRPAVTTSSSPTNQLRWGQYRYDHATWGALRTRKWGQL